MVTLWNEGSKNKRSLANDGRVVEYLKPKLYLSVSTFECLISTIYSNSDCLEEGRRILVIAKHRLNMIISRGQHNANKQISVILFYTCVFNLKTDGLESWIIVQSLKKASTVFGTKYCWKLLRHRGLRRWKVMTDYKMWTLKTSGTWTAPWYGHWRNLATANIMVWKKEQWWKMCFLEKQMSSIIIDMDTTWPNKYTAMFIRIWSSSFPHFYRMYSLLNLTASDILNINAWACVHNLHSVCILNKGDV